MQFANSPRKKRSAKQIIMTALLLLLSLIFLFQKQTDIYIISFYQIDNKVEIIINDSIIYSSGEVDRNPDFEGLLTVNISKHLTRPKNEVIVRLYNGFEPYPEDEKDKHWEIEYSILKNEQEIDFMWNEGDDFRNGLVFEERYLF